MLTHLNITYGFIDLLLWLFVSYFLYYLSECPDEVRRMANEVWIVSVCMTPYWVPWADPILKHLLDPSYSLKSNSEKENRIFTLTEKSIFSAVSWILASTYLSVCHEFKQRVNNDSQFKEINRSARRLSNRLRPWKPESWIMAHRSWLFGHYIL